MITFWFLFIEWRKITRPAPGSSDGRLQPRATRKPNASQSSRGPKLPAALESTQRVCNAERIRTSTISTTGEQFCL